MTIQELGFHYQKHLTKRKAEGFSPYRAHFFANADLEIEQREFMEINKPITVNIPGVGNCQYSGD